MKELILTRDKKALVDDEDYERANAYKWCCHKLGYAERTIRINKKKHAMRLHNFIMNPPDNLVVDHINGNKLDNRKENLRICTWAENTRNCKKRKTLTSSVFKGACLHSRDGTWGATIGLNNQRFHIGSFKTEIQAAMAYDIWAKELFGEYAKLNFKPI